MAIADDIEALIARSPGLTQAEIAVALFGDAGYPGRVARLCINLMKSGRIERSGRGGRNDPFRYFPRGVLTTPSSSVKRRRYPTQSR